MQTQLDRNSRLIRERQERFCSIIKARNLAGALIMTPENVQYLTGFRPSRHRPAAVWVASDGAIHAAVAEGDSLYTPIVNVCFYEANIGGTIVDHAIGRAAGLLKNMIPHDVAIGADALPIDNASPIITVQTELHKLRRRKDAFEVELLVQSAAVLESVYRHIAQVITPSMTEIELCAECHRAAVTAAGGPIGWLGNDFQSGTGGGPPRNREIEPGELLPLDLGIGVNGYFADLCRTYCIGKSPTAAQQRAHQRSAEVIDFARSMLKPGTSCRALHQRAIEMLDGFDGLTFRHHLGHGIGLNVHEAPRISIHSDDMLEVGDVVTIEPGLYGDGIRGGVRLEDNYLITDTGFEQLSNFPLEYH